MNYLGFAGYLLLVALIAIYAWRHTETIDDYVLGGRRLGAKVAALSAGASDMSGWLLLGLPGLAVIAPATALWTAVGLLVGTWFNWKYVAAPLRVASGELGALTLPSFFALRFPSRGGLLRSLSAASIVVFFLLYTAAGLVAGGKLFSAAFELPYTYGVIGSAMLITAYTVVGGFLAVSWTDVLQALLMSAMLVVVALGLALQPSQGSAFIGLGLLDGQTAAIVSALAWGLGYMGQPHILARFMAMTSASDVPRAARVALTWAAFSLCAAVLVGLYGAGLVDAGGDPEQVFILAAQVTLPQWLSGICMAAILAAIMSTADSQLLVTASSLAEDIVPQVTRATTSETGRLWVGRAAVVVVCALACAFALNPEQQVLGLVALAWAGFGATFAPALLIALYRPNATANGAVGGIAAGALTVTCWPMLPNQGFGLYELLPAFAFALLINLGINHWQSSNER